MQSHINLNKWQEFGDEYAALELKSVKETVSIMVDVAKAIEDQVDKYGKKGSKDTYGEGGKEGGSNKEKLKLAKEKLEEKGKRTSQLHSEATANEVKLLDSTYEDKYGEVIEAHKPTKAYLKANGKTIALYKRDMALMNEQMKNAEILGLDEEWQKAQVQKIKDDNQSRIDELDKKKAKAEEAAKEADEQKEQIEAIEKAVPEFENIGPLQNTSDEKGAKVFYTKGEWEEIENNEEEVVAAEALVNEVETANMPQKEAGNKDQTKVSYVISFAKLTHDKDLGKEIQDLRDKGIDDKDRLKDALDAFLGGYQEFREAELALDTLKQKVAETIENMDKDERPEGASGFVSKWGTINLDQYDEKSQFEISIDKKIEMCNDEESKSKDILDFSIGKTKNPEVEKLEKEIKELEAQKLTHQEDIKKLQDGEVEDENTTKEQVEKLNGEIETLQGDKTKYQEEIKQLQAA